MFAGLLTLLLCTAVAEPPDTAIVCSPHYLAALEPWLVHRAEQGHRFAYVSNLGTPEQIRGGIRQAAAAGSLRFVLIVGDDEPGSDHDPRLRERCTPSFKQQAQVVVHWGSEPEIATDNWYADLDDDHCPDLAVGRLPADSPEELQRIVQKILRYENEAAHGAWRRRINLVAGVGDFGPLIDTMLEGFAKRLLTDGIPAGYATTMTYANWRSPYCPDPRSFRETTLARLSEGCLLWIYLGHGQPHGLDWMRIPGAAFPILNADDLGPLQATTTTPVAVLLACYTGAFDAQQDCLAEEMLRAEGGPVAVLSGSRVTMPYAMAVLGQELMSEFFDKQPDTLGEMVLHAKQRTIRNGSARSGTRLVLDTLASLFSSAEMLPAERAEHAALFNLIGDPLLRINHPEPITVDLLAGAVAGQHLEVTGTFPIDGRCTIELACRRDRWTVPPPIRDTFDGSDAILKAFDVSYEQANEQCWYVDSFDVHAGRFQTRLPVPASAHGPCHVRLFVEGAEGHALGAAMVNVQAAGE